jgi:hypothetical protein
MMRFLSRALGLALLAGALVAIISDAARSIAASRLSFTEIGPVWSQTSSYSLTQLQEFVEIRIEPDVGHWVWDPVITALLALPVSTVLAGIGFVLVFLGAPRRRRAYA